MRWCISLLFSAEEQGFGLSTCVEADAAVKVTYTSKIESIHLQNTHMQGKAKAEVLQGTSTEKHNWYRAQGTAVILPCTPIPGAGGTAVYNYNTAKATYRTAFE